MVRDLMLKWKTRVGRSVLRLRLPNSDTLFILRIYLTAGTYLNKYDLFLDKKYIIMILFFNIKKIILSVVVL